MTIDKLLELSIEVTIGVKVELKPSRFFFCRELAAFSSTSKKFREYFLKSLNSTKIATKHVENQDDQNIYVISS